MDHVAQRTMPVTPTRGGALTAPNEIAPRAQSLTPATIATDSRLLSDFVLTNDILLDASALNPLAVFANAQGQSEALAIHADDGLLYHVYRDAGASGWNLQEVGGGMQVSEVVADRDHQDGAVKALFVGPQSEVYAIAQSTDGTWSAPQDVACQASNLGITGMFDAGAAMKTLAAYGVTADGHREIFIPAGGPQWGFLDYSDSLQSQPLQLIPSESGAWSLYAVIGGQLACTVVDFDVMGNPWTFPTEADGFEVKRLKQLVTIPGMTSILLALDADQLLWAIVPVSANTVSWLPVSNLTMSKACVTRRADDATKLQLYALDTDGHLWVIRQNYTTDEGMPVFYKQVPLGDNFVHIATPPNANTSAEFLGLDTGGALHHMFQDPATMRWTVAPVLQPAQSTPQNVSRYHTVATVYDANNLPVPNVTVTITPAAATSLWIDGATVYTAADQPVTGQTNAMGKVTVASPAFTLHPPALTFSVGAVSAPPVNPAKAVHAFLSGAQALNGMAPMDPQGTTLLNATVTDAHGNQEPLAPNLASIPDTAAQAKLAAKAATGIVNAMNYPLPGATAPVAGWALSLRDPLNPTFVTFATADELHAYRAAKRAAQPPSDDWSDVATFMGDVWHAIDTTFVQATDWTVDAINQVVDITIQIESDLVQLTNIAVHELADLVSMVQSIFAAIGAFIENVIEWLRAVFDWHDIWNTKLVFEHMFLGAIPALQFFIDKRAKVDAGTFFAGLKVKVESAFQDAQPYVQGKTFADVSQAPSPASALPAVGAQDAINPLDVLMRSAETMWVWGSIFHYLPGSKSLDFDPPVDLTGSIDTLSGQLADTLTDLQNAVNGTGLVTDMTAAYQDLDKFFHDVTHYQSGQSPSDIFNGKLVSDFLSLTLAFINVALDVLDVIVTAVLDLLDSMLGYLEDVLTHALDIPVLSWLYEQIQSENDSSQTPQKLSIIGLCALMLAAPATVSYKLASNNQAPFSDDDVQNILAWNFVAPGSGSARGVHTGVGGQPFLSPIASGVDKGLYMALCLSMAGLDVFLDGLNPPDLRQPTAPSSSDPAVTILNWADVVNSALLQIVSVPNDESWFGNDAENWIDGVWIAGWALPVVNAALLFPNIQKSLRSPEWGKVMLSVGGFAVMACGIAAAVKGTQATPPMKNGWDIANAILSPMDDAFQFLRLTCVEENTYTLSLWAKEGLNLVADVGAGVTNIPG